ncbi:hypothetical protein NZK35_05440 [Stieleria sp. ICT_E10.1]|uniref:hypothetical protein n=1 Tax=Stieleria sedimenti TaxID=2976331 RepID=UPI00217F7B6B|nr:hypothetical protein [Stieleria sedimenti]MCS7466116.1 hypothetical protein [Stieleria sedimenti]
MDLITAIHEAGHTVAHRRFFPNWYLFGVACVLVEEQEEEGAAGWSANEQLSGNEDAQTMADFDTYLCAGYGAVLAARYSEDEAAAGCENDFSKVQGARAAAKAMALDLMRQPENVKAVKRIADELMLRRRLHSDHVTMLIDLSDGEITESEYQEALSFRGWNNNEPTLEPDA